MNGMRKTVLLAALALFGCWVAANFARITGDQHGMVRFVLGTILAICILCRPKPKPEGPPRHTLLILALGGMGVLGAIGGIVFRVHQFEWLGIMLLLYACLRWSLPDRYSRDIVLALLLLYWLHPLPSQVFGRLQLTMQAWSVAGAEWILHCCNVRVWAEGFFLHTGFDVVGVPESCSGMRTSLTVLLCALGIGVLYRFHWLEMTILVLGGLLQVLALNVARITAVVIQAPKMPPEWSDNFLHDTLGLFLMAAILLTQLEASAWQVFKMRRRRVAEGMQSGELERPEKATRLPRFWSLFFRWANMLFFGTLFSVGIVFLAYKSRPEHRDVMRREVIDGLMETDLQIAERAIAAARLKAPKDRDLLAKQARVQVMRRDFEGALKTFDLIPGGLGAFETTLKSWSLMAVGKANEAVALIDALPENARRLPGVAMVRAEYAAIQGDPKLASHYIVYAGNAAIDAGRVRALYPYLARHEQWAAIAKSDRDLPYEEIGQALIAVHACLRIGDLDGAARTLNIAMRQWGNDPRFLRSLFVLASRRPASEWEDRFAASFRENYTTLDAESLVPYLAYCFQLSRPDLAWLAYLRLLQLDARHPDVFYAPAQFGGKWMTFRRQQIGVGGQDRSATIDLRPLAAATRRLWPLSRLWDRMPLSKELAAASAGQIRSRYMKWTLAELEVREQNGTLSRRGELIYPGVLAAEARYDEAHHRLDLIRTKYPTLDSQVLLEHAEFYDLQKRWEESYENLREYYQLTDLVELQADLLMVNALLNLNLAVYALDVANRMAVTFPGVSFCDLVRAAIWDIFGFKDQALFVLKDHEDDVFLYTAARLNAETGRLQEAERVNAALGSSFSPGKVAARQALVPVPAEMAVARRWPPTRPEDLEREAVFHEQRLTNSTTPFIRELGRRTVAWYRLPAASNVADAAYWREAGRDPLERATALHRLAVLQARSQQFDAATASARLALEEAPQSPMLWRILVALSEGDPVVARAAREACGDDPEIWLASLVTRYRAEGAGDWMLAEVKLATVADESGRPKRFSSDTLVRAGDFCLRHGMRDAAEYLARWTMPKCRGLVSAYMLGLRCALEARDADWAMECARQGIQHAVDPGIFYRAIVQIKTIQETKDADLILALEWLKDHFPADNAWGQYLGHVYFFRGDMDRALTILDPLISQEMSGVRVRSLLLAAEAARVAGHEGKALGILERALALHPDQMSILNNLVYNLVQRRDTVPRAAQLLPQLLELGGDSFAVLDTAAMVYLRSGDIGLAQEYMDRAMSLMNADDYAALETRLNAAEVYLAQRKFAEARERISEVRQDPRISSFLEVRARRLLEEVQQQQQLEP